MLALVVCEEGGRGAGHPSEFQTGRLQKRKPAREKGKTVRGRTFPMHRPSMDVPGKSLLDVIIRKKKKESSPISLDL